MRYFLNLVIAVLGFLATGMAQESVIQRITMQDGLASDYALVMIVDHKGACWIGTDKGLCRYDGAGIQVLNMDDGLTNNHVTSLLQDQKKRIWVSTIRGGLAEVAVEAGRLKIKGIYKAGMDIRRIHQDKQGIFSIVELTNDGRARIWRTRDMDQPWTAICTCSQPMHIVVDANGQIWTMPNVHVVWHQQHVPHRTAYVAGNEKAIVLANSANKVAIWNKNQAVIHDVRFPKDSTVISFQHAQLAGLPRRFYSNDSLDFFYKSIGVVRQFRLGKLQNVLRYPQSGKQLLAFEMAMDSTGHLLFSDFGNGVVFWQPTYATFYPNKLPVRRIALHKNAVSYSTEESIHIIRQESISVVKPKTNALPINFHAVDTFRQRLIIGGYNLFFGENSQSIFAEHPEFSDFSDILFSHDSCFISSYSWGLFLTIGGKVDWKWKKALNMPQVNMERLRLYGDYLYGLTLSNGFWRIHLPRNEVVHFSTGQGLPSNSIYDVFQEKDSLWVASAKGLSLILKDTSYHFTKQQGFQGNRALSVFRDRKKNLWVLSDKYLHLFRDKQLYAIQSHPLNPDSRSYIISARFQEASNTLWVGTNKGLLGVYPDSIAPIQSIAAPSIEAVWIDDKMVSLQDSTLVLTSNNQSFKIKLTNIRHGLHSRAIVETRLLGHQPEWATAQEDYLIQYNRLPPGKYALEMRVNGPDFVRSQPRTLVYITVRPPWWKSNWFILLAAALLAVFAVLATRYVYAYRYRQRLKAFETAKALEVERSRISRELHDNVGSMLTVIITKLEDGPTPKAEQGTPIHQIARSSLSHLKDAIWALDTPHLTMDLWNGRTIDFLQTMKRPGLDIDWQFDWPKQLELSPIKALHSFRILQEACNNALKHGNATSISVAGSFDGRLMLHISDNGKGFELGKQKIGYGLRNMQKRAKELNGELVVKSQPQRGTTISLSWPPGE